MSGTEDEPGQLEADKNREGLETWRDIWDDAKDAPEDIREPARFIVDAMAAGVEGRTVDITRLRLEVRNLLTACERN